MLCTEHEGRMYAKRNLAPTINQNNHDDMNKIIKYLQYGIYYCTVY